MFENNPFVAHTLEILIMLIGAAIIGLWLGWILWGRLKEELDRLRVENQSLNVTVDAIRLEAESLKTRAVVAESDNSNYITQALNLNRENSSLREKIAFLESEMDALQNRNRKVETELGLSYTPDTPILDDIPLEIKNAISEVMVDQAPVSMEEEVPEAAPSTLELTVDSEVLNAPVVIQLEPMPLVDLKAEKPSRQKSPAPTEPSPSPATSMDREDLTVIEGIGPKIQLLLNQYGISTYRNLAETDVQRLKEILSEAGPQLAMHDPGTWPSQASLAANDQWDTLKSVQGFLKGGKKPD